MRVRTKSFDTPSHNEHHRGHRHHSKTSAFGKRIQIGIESLKSIPFLTLTAKKVIQGQYLAIFPLVLLQFTLSSVLNGYISPRSWFILPLTILGFKGFTLLYNWSVALLNVGTFLLAVFKLVHVASELPSNQWPREMANWVFSSPSLFQSGLMLMQAVVNWNIPGFGFLKPWAYAIDTLLFASTSSLTARRYLKKAAHTVSNLTTKVSHELEMEKEE